MPIPKWPGLPRPAAPLPDLPDFDPWDGSLDAQSAWRNFGGLTLAQAWEVFADSPIHYQEDFMFMGPVAFAYYFPVIDRHLREARLAEEDDDCLAWIIGYGVQMQLEGDHRFSEALLQEIAELAGYMKDFVEKFGLVDGERVTGVWEKVAAEVERWRGRR